LLVERSPIVDLSLGPITAQAVHVAADLGLADLLADGPRTGDELAAETGTHPPTLRRLLRALTALGVLTQAGPDRFGLTDVGGHLRSDTPDSVRSLATLMGVAEWWQAWGGLASSVRTGEPAFEQIFGEPVFDFLGRNPDKAAVFARAMTELTRDMAPDIAAGYDFSKFGTIVDVGGGEGTLLAHILRANPDMRAVLLDGPSGLEAAPGVLASAGVADRCEIVPGDFFSSVPSGGDAYVLKAVLHDWDDDRAVTILRNCRRAMAPGGRVLIVEKVIPDLVTAADTEVVVADLIMLTLTSGGRERTESDFRTLLAAAGLAITTLSDPVTPQGDRVIEAAAAAA
jgi:SAM-dependent methyltransferase